MIVLVSVTPLVRKIVSKRRTQPDFNYFRMIPLYARRRNKEELGKYLFVELE
jgi:hypothetical protein